MTESTTVALILTIIGGIIIFGGAWSTYSNINVEGKPDDEPRTR